ncbi:MAG: hypothetical protein AABX84_00615 [Nanoarchaeota archaeon]
MPEYLVTISGTAVEYGLGEKTPYGVNEAIRFQAEDEKLAKVEANKRLSELKKRLIYPKISLKSLDQLASIPLD